MTPDPTASTPADGARAEGRIDLLGGYWWSPCRTEDGQPAYEIFKPDGTWLDASCCPPADARAFAAALAAPAAGAGHALVPREPTAEMVEAYEDQWDKHGNVPAVEILWAAMIAAAPPAAPAGDEPKGRLRALLEEIVQEFGGTIAGYDKDGPHWTGRDGTEKFDVSVVLDRRELIEEARELLASRPAPAPPAGRAPAGVEERTPDYIDLPGGGRMRHTGRVFNSGPDRETFTADLTAEQIRVLLDALRGGGARGGGPFVRLHRSQPWSDEQEAEARRVYEGWSSQAGYVPWVEGGNSDKQFEARDVVRNRARIEAEGRPGRAGGEGA